MDDLDDNFLTVSDYYTLQYIYEQCPVHWIAARKLTLGDAFYRLRELEYIESRWMDGELYLCLTNDGRDMATAKEIE